MNAKVQSVDFNDAAKRVGKEGVRRAVQRAASKSATAGGGNTRSTHDKDVDSNADAAPKAHFILKNSGVYFVGVDGDGELSPPQWICSPLKVMAKTRDKDSRNWGRLLNWTDSDGNEHAWACPAELLVGEPREFMRRLSADGVEISPHPKTAQRLVSYITLERSDARAVCVPCPGWHGSIYVLPTREAFGGDGEKIVFQHAGEAVQRYGVAGTLDEWKRNVAALCLGNSRLLFAVSAMFAGPLLRFAGAKGGGFNFKGTGEGTSIGKTTALHVAASVAGSPDYMRGWRSTANGLEGVAVLHNDATLLLDELGDIDPREVGEAVYMLANGGGKSRADRSGAARAATQWQTLILSTGEAGLAEHMATVGMRARPGQLARLVDIPAEVEGAYGAFETLHDTADGAEFSKRVEREAADCYGAAWPAWLDKLTSIKPAALAKAIHKRVTQWRADHVTDAAVGEVHRVADRFALVAAAGEMATAAGITGWPEGSASKAATACFHAWVKHRGGTSGAKEIALLFLPWAMTVKSDD